jgi:DNA segregation ATPase FtsK/SpoIIIE, S-DNA-T family
MTNRHPVRALVALLLGLVVLVSLLSFRPGDWSGWGWDGQLLEAQNAFGFLGAIVAKLLIFLMGALAIWLVTPFFLIAAGSDLFGRSRRKPLLAWTGAALLILLWGGSDLVGGPLEARQGWLGALLSEGLRSLTGAMGSQIILAFLSLIGLLLLLPGRFLDALRRALSLSLRAVATGLTWTLNGIGEVATATGRGLFAGLRWVGVGITALAGRSAEALTALFASRGESAPAAVKPAPASRPAQPEILETIEVVEEELPAARAATAVAGTTAPKSRSPRSGAKRATGSRKQGKFVLPDPVLLADPGHRGGLEDRRFVEERAQILVDKLASFNIGGKVSAMSQGPVVTTYEFEPDTGVKVSQIISRREDLALALRSKELRMVAPIPGKAAVGIELPNPKPRVIRLREVLEATDARNVGGDLALALGVDVDGVATWTDLAEMPHLLVAGATGTGKSVCINVILVSLLLAHTPDTLKLFLVDPKMLELSIYDEIPHLLHPVITDNRVALQALNWLVGEMERRYLLLKPAGVRSIGEYNTKVKAGDVKGPDGETITDTLPFLVGVVEEFADLMMTMGKDIQTPIIRLAQMARAVGIHLILATQRPSVDIIDGVIKANFPSRIAFKVFSRFDSKTILDGNGAETLIGRGDMLFKHGRQPFPQRLHGAFIETDEVERVVAHWREYANGKEQVDLAPRKDGTRDYLGEDELFDDCKRIVVMHGFGSTTMLQRRLRIGYTRASRLMDMLEDAGIVGPHTGSKAREVLVGPEVLEGGGDEAPL